MTNNVLSIWQSSAEQARNALILPDGCQDVIFKVEPKQRPVWLVSELFSQSKWVSSPAGTAYFGFRLRPGIQINQHAILPHLTGREFEPELVLSVLQDHCQIDGATSEALACLAGNVLSVKSAAQTLGVTERTLQRRMLAKTGQSPCYWLQLARVRRAAKAIPESDCWSSLAQQQGYCDQSHMNRALKHWLLLTPTAIVRSGFIHQQLNDLGYG